MKMYVLVRDDLCPAQTAVQAAHATHHAGSQFGAPNQCTLVLCSIPRSRFDLWKGELDNEGIRYHEFYEPDIADHTAIATEPKKEFPDRFKKLNLYRGRESIRV